MFRGSVKSTGYPLHTPVSLSLPITCVTVCHHISTGVYLNCEAHAQKLDFVFRRKWGFHLDRPGGRGGSVQLTTGSRGVRISGSNAGYTMFRGSVKGTGYPLHSPVSPSLPLPCGTVCHHISTAVYLSPCTAPCSPPRPIHTVTHCRYYVDRLQWTFDFSSLRLHSNVRKFEVSMKQGRSFPIHVTFLSASQSLPRRVSYETSWRTRNWFITSKVVLLYAWSGPEGFRKLRFPDFVTTAQDVGKVVSLTHRPPLPPRKSSFLLHSAIGKILYQWKIPTTPAGIEPATFQFVAQHLNHCATAVPFITSNIYNFKHMRQVFWVSCCEQECSTCRNNSKLELFSVNLRLFVVSLPLELRV